MVKFRDSNDENLSLKGLNGSYLTSNLNRVTAKNQPDKTPLDFSNVLVTGGMGFIGGHFIEHILHSNADCTITILDSLTYAAQQSLVRTFSNHRQIRFICGDIRDPQIVKQAVKGQDAIFHFAAETHVPRSFGSEDLFYQTNVLGTQNLVRAAKQLSNIRFTHISTDEVYGATQNFASENHCFKPTTPYSKSKAMAERQVWKAIDGGLDAVVVRPANAIGTRQHIEKVAPRFVKLALDRMPLTIEGDGRQERNFIPVTDLARAIAMLHCKGTTGEAYNVPGLEFLSILEFADLVRSVSHSDCNHVHIKDRMINDSSYRISGEKIKALGFKQYGSVTEELHKIADQFLSDDLSKETSEKQFSMA